MIYERREWYEDLECLYTDDSRVKDIALRAPDLQIASAYFRTVGERQPFAWDIVGPSETIRPIAGRFEERSRHSSMRARSRGAETDV